MGSRLEKQLGERVAQHRGAAGLTQAELADRVGVAFETISRLERGVSVPSLARLDKLARTLGLDLVELLDFTRSVPGRRPGATRSPDSKERALAALLKDLQTRDRDEIVLVHEIASRILRFSNRRKAKRSKR